MKRRDFIKSMPFLAAAIALVKPKKKPANQIKCDSHMIVSGYDQDRVHKTIEVTLKGSEPVITPFTKITKVTPLDRPSIKGTITIPDGLI